MEKVKGCLKGVKFWQGSGVGEPFWCGTWQDSFFVSDSTWLAMDLEGDNGAEWSRGDKIPSRDAYTGVPCNNPCQFPRAVE